MSGLLTFEDVADKVGASLNRLNYVLARDGITAAKRSGRGRGGGRMFTRAQLKWIKLGLSKTREYTPRLALLDW